LGDSACSVPLPLQETVGQCDDSDEAGSRKRGIDGVLFEIFSGAYDPRHLAVINIDECHLTRLFVWCLLLNRTKQAPYLFAKI